MTTPLPTGTNFALTLLARLGLATALSLLLDNMPSKAYSIDSVIAQNPPATQATPETTHLYVNPTRGNDGSGNGSEQGPFKTITQALRMATRGTVIELAPGTYSAETGESFPIQLKPGVIVQGDPTNKGRNVVIRGGGLFMSRTFARQNIGILGAEEAALAGVTVTNTNQRGYGLWIESTSMVVADNTFIANTHDGISVTGNSAPLIRNNYFADNGANGITIFNTAKPQVRENVFERTGFGIAIAQNSAPIIINNRISQNKDGIVVYGKAQPVLRNNRIEGNIRDGLVATQDARPDVGTAAEPGGNIFRNNRRYDINTTAANQRISAFGNQIAGGRVAGSLDVGAGERVSRRAGGNNIQLSPRANSPTAIPIPVPPPNRGTAPTNGVSGIPIPVPPPARATAPTRRVTGRSRRWRRGGWSRRRYGRRFSAAPIAPRAVAAPLGVNALRIPAAPIAPRAVAAPLGVNPPRIPAAPIAPRAVLPIPLANLAPEITRQPTQSRVQPIMPKRDRLPDVRVQPGVVPAPGEPSFERNPGNLRSVEIPSTPSAVGEPLPPSSTAAVSAGYQVVVLVETVEQEQLLLQLVPDAVRVGSAASIVMQVGLFRDRSSAEQMLQKMIGNGLNAMIEELSPIKLRQSL